MILNTGNRTDIPAFYSEWLMNRFREGYALSRNPYNPGLVTRYLLDPETIDGVIFCTKNPGPMLPHTGEIKDMGFRQYWHVTITPYGKEIETNVPPYREVIDSFKKMAAIVGPSCMAWRYDPILLLEPDYTEEKHLEYFAEMAGLLKDSTKTCVISFLDLYEKTRRNFPEGRTVPMEAQRRLAEAIAKICRENGMRLHTCCENAELAEYGIDTSGCMTGEVLERAWEIGLDVPASAKQARGPCSCILGGDIGAYNTCPHGCRYCYANYDRDAVRESRKQHDPASPLLIGHLLPTDKVTDALQKSWYDGQIAFL